MLPPIPSNAAGRLAALREFALLGTPPDRAFDGLVRPAVDRPGAPVTLIRLFERQRQWVKRRIGATLTETPHEGAFRVPAIPTDGIPVVENATQGVRFGRNALVVNSPQERFRRGIPLRTAGERRLARSRSWIAGCAAARARSGAGAA